MVAKTAAIEPGVMIGRRAWFARFIFEGWGMVFQIISTYLVCERGGQEEAVDGMRETL
jgi:hypothetical protein